MSLASPTLTPSYSTGSTSYSGEGRRHMRRKDFQYKYGKKHHSYDKEKAPYPLSYDRNVLELCVLLPQQRDFPLSSVDFVQTHLREGLDNRMVQHLRGSISFVPFREQQPTRVLDLGCGVRCVLSIAFLFFYNEIQTGNWIIDAAKAWPECEFVRKTSP